MKITDNQIKEEHIQLMYTSYLKEAKFLEEFPIISFQDYSKIILDSNLSCISLYSEDTLLASLLYEYREDKEIDLSIPIFGYGFIDIKYLSRLFQELLKRKVTKTTHIAFNGYAHDTDLYRYLTLTRFGISMSYCVRKIKKVPNVNTYYPVRKLTKEEMNLRWDEVWTLIHLMVNHLHESPVFWFGDYTNEYYKNFFNEPEVDVYAAFDGNKMIGIIETNSDEEGFLLHQEARNISEAIVLEDYRGIGVSEALLSAVEKELSSQGIEYAWVNHGTANPNARGFWDKYFNPYYYTFVRDIYFDDRKLTTSYIEDVYD